MISASVVINDKVGLHLRPASVLCKTACSYKCKVKLIVRNTVEANAKSVISVLAACVKCNDTIEIVCDGEDEEEALKSIVEAVKYGLEEYGK